MCALPLASSQPPSSTLLVSPNFHALPSPGPHLAPRTSHCLYAFISAPQRASSFNQPLSLDTSSVTTMFGMLGVRSPALYLRRRHLTALPLPDPGLTSPRLTSPLLPTRQSASAFNQPLSLDTSSVTTMYGMFHVRSLHATCAVAVLWPSHFLTSPHLTSPLLPTRQSASAFNQPLSFDTSSVTTMQGMFQVRSTPVLSPICSRASTARWTPSPPSAIPHPRPAPYALLSTLGRARRRSTSR